MRYTVTAYFSENLTGVVSVLATDDFAKVQEFVSANCQHDFHCEIIDEELGEIKIIRPEIFYDDLFMEQQEQM